MWADWLPTVCCRHSFSVFAATTGGFGDSLVLWTGGRGGFIFIHHFFLPVLSAAHSNSRECGLGLHPTLESTDPPGFGLILAFEFILVRLQPQGHFFLTGERISDCWWDNQDWSHWIYEWLPQLLPTQHPALVQQWLHPQDRHPPLSRQHPILGSRRACIHALSTLCGSSLMCKASIFTFLRGCLPPISWAPSPCTCPENCQLLGRRGGGAMQSWKQMDSRT